MLCETFSISFLVSERESEMECVGVLMYDILFCISMVVEVDEWGSGAGLVFVLMLGFIVVVVLVALVVVWRADSRDAKVRGGFGGHDYEGGS